MLPAQTAELNVHFGVFFGGLGDFSESYLNSVDNFRGCMSDVCFFIYFYFSPNLPTNNTLHFVYRDAFRSYSLLCTSHFTSVLKEFKVFSYF